MSIKVTTTIWERSKLGGSELLLLLAIADFASDEGVAFPSVQTLAKKIRMSVRNTRYLLAKLGQSGEIAIERNAGPGGCNVFRVGLTGTANLAGLQTLQDESGSRRGVQPVAVPPAIAVAPEPSLTVIEPPKEVVARKRDLLRPESGLSPATPEELRCPVDEIVELYHECMPRNPRCKVLTKARRGSISARWKEAAGLTCSPFGYTTKEEGLAAWREFFETCAESAFLTGRAKPQPGRPPFVADIDFLMSPSGFAKCLENKYHRVAA